MYYKRILTFDLPVLYSPHEPVNFLGIFYLLDPDPHLSMRILIRIQEDFLNADPCRSGSAALFYFYLTCHVIVIIDLYYITLHTA